MVLPDGEIFGYESGCSQVGCNYTVLRNPSKCYATTLIGSKIVFYERPLV